jgi:hypothetical protein
MRTYSLKNEKYRIGVEAIIGKLPPNDMIAERSTEARLLKNLGVLDLWMSRSITYSDSETDFLLWMSLTNALFEGRIINFKI